MDTKRFAISCPGKRLRDGLLVDPCRVCQRQGEGRVVPAAEFIDKSDFVGWQCEQQIKDRPQAR